MLLRRRRDMAGVADNSVALVVTSPPVLRRQGVRGRRSARATSRRNYLEYLEMLHDVFAECVRMLEPGGRIAVNVANLGRKPYRSLSADVTDPRRTTGPAAARRGHLGEGPGRRRLLRVGLVPAARQPGAARPDRAGRRRQQGPLRPRGPADEAGEAAGCRTSASLFKDEFMEATTDVWEMPPESANAGRPPGAVPGRAARAPDPALHLRGRPRARPVHGSGTTAVAAVRTGRHYVGYDTDATYVERALQRVESERRRSRPTTQARPGGRPFASARRLVLHLTTRTSRPAPYGRDTPPVTWHSSCWSNAAFGRSKPT